MRRSAWVLAVLVAGCLRPSEERAEQDLEVGHESAAGLRIDVSDGLGAVRSVEPGGLRLWASAPTLTITLERPDDAEADWHVEVDNCLPDAELEGPDGVVVAELDRVLSTRCSWQVVLPPGVPVVLTVRSPRDRTAGAFRFGLLSDVQDAVDQVQDLYDRMNQDPALDFVLGTGDVTGHGSAQEYRTFQAALDGLTVPYFTTLGNHELGESPCRFQEYFGRGNLHFVFRGVHFTLLDSASGTLDPLVYDWLDGWLEAGRSSVHVVAMHMPPLDPVGLRNGAFSSRIEAGKLLGELAEGGVDLTLYGHVHSFYHFHNAGIPAYLSGGGGLPERFDGIGRHYVAIDVDPVLGLQGVEMVEVD